jgi:hypothetical protein
MSTKKLAQRGEGGKSASAAQPSVKQILAPLLVFVSDQPHQLPGSM